MTMMRKLGVFLLLAAVLFVFAGFAGAATQSVFGGTLSVYVPDGWKLVEDDDEGKLTFIGPNGVLTFNFDVIEGTTAEKYAEKLSKDWGGGKPERSRKGDSYVFVYKDDSGDDCYVFVSGRDGMYFTIVVDGDLDEMDPIVASIVESIE